MHMTDYELIKTALSIAKEAHKGQTDKAGEAYIFHPVTVALLCDTAKAKAAALLHDTLEDCPETVSYELLAERVGKDVADAVRLLTNDGSKGSYLDYVQSIRDSGNPIAIAVKKADLTMNMDLSRIPVPTERDLQRIRDKYEPAMRILTGEPADVCR